MEESSLSLKKKTFLVKFSFLSRVFTINDLAASRHVLYTQCVNEVYHEPEAADA